MDYSLIIASSAGLLLGVITDFMFVKGSSRGTNNVLSIFGMSSNDLINNILFFSVVFAIVLFAGLSYLVRDLDYPKSNPFYFTLETLFATFVPATLVYAIMFFRGISPTMTRNIEYLIICSKFGLFHILFQFSGVYTYALS